MSVEQMRKQFGERYEARWFEQDGKFPAQWRLFRDGAFVFSARTLVEVERFVNRAQQCASNSEAR